MKPGPATSISSHNEIISSFLFNKEINSEAISFGFLFKSFDKIKLTFD